MAKMMIVDDAIILRGVLKFILERAGHLLLGMVESPAEALNMYKTSKADIVFCEVSPTGLDGLAVIRELLKADPAARIIAITSKGNEASGEEAIVLGACAHIQKPYGVVSVNEAIETAMKKR